MSNSAPSPDTLDVLARVAQVIESRKGGDPETLDTVKSSPGLQDLWQLHYSPKAGGAKNAPADFIANTQDPCAGKLIKVVVQRDGTFAITNSRNGFTKTYQPLP